MVSTSHQHVITVHAYKNKIIFYYFFIILGKFKKEGVLMIKIKDGEEKSC